MSGLSAAEELRMMELELAILQKKRDLAAGSSKGSGPSGSSTPDDGPSLVAAAATSAIELNGITQQVGDRGCRSRDEALETNH